MMESLYEQSSLYTLTAGCRPLAVLGLCSYLVRGCGGGCGACGLVEGGA
jgi:hypothetical protein